MLESIMNCFAEETILSKNGPRLALAFSLTSSGREALHRGYFFACLKMLHGESQQRLPKLDDFKKMASLRTTLK
jgi:hypothetical protein